MKNYKDPKDPQLNFNSHKQMEFIYHDPFGSMEKYMPKRHISDHIFMDASLHDDLETILSMIQKFNGIKLDVDQKSIFYFFRWEKT